MCNKVEGDIVSIDGKTIRRSGSRDKKAIHMVSAWANKQQVVLGQMATDKKSNEITAVIVQKSILFIDRASFYMLKFKMMHC